jgi:hypothetical protein
MSKAVCARAKEHWRVLVRPRRAARHTDRQARRSGAELHGSKAATGAARAFDDSIALAVYGACEMNWLPDGFTHPERVDLSTGHHLRPIREADVDIDYPAVMGSRERLWAKYGDAWGWPPTTMTYDADKTDLARHEAEIAARETFNYAVLDGRETELLGCVYIDPPDAQSPRESEAVVSWWVVDPAVGTELERTLDDFVPRWLADTWSFEKVHYFP